MLNIIYECTNARIPLPNERELNPFTADFLVAFKYKIRNLQKSLATIQKVKLLTNCVVSFGC